MTRTEDGPGGSGQLRQQRVSIASSRCLEARREYQGGAADVAQRELELRASERRIDVDQDQPGPGGGEHSQQPFQAVRRPDADALSRLEAAGDHSARRPLHLAVEFGKL